MMVLVLITSLIAVCLGAVSAYYSKITYAIIAACLPVIAIILRPAIAVGASASGASGYSNPLAIWIEGFQMLPAPISNSLMAFPILFVLGRLGGWLYRISTDGEEAVAFKSNVPSDFSNEDTWENIIAAKREEETRHAEIRNSRTPKDIKFGQRKVR